MSSSSEPRRRSLFSRVLGGFDLFRRLVLNLLFLFLLVLIFAALSQDGLPRIPEKGALVIAPVGDLVEQLSGDPIQRAINKIADSEMYEILLWDVLDVIDAAREDDRIQALVLDLDRLAGAGLPALQEVRLAMERFRESGKPIYARGDSLTRNGYYLAAAADEIHLHEMGMVLLPGYGYYRSYYKEGMDRLGVEWHVYRHGMYKSGPEPFLRNDMSEPAEIAAMDFLEDLWGSWLEQVASRRNMSPEELDALSEELVARLEATEGDMSEAALAAGLVDHVGHRDSLRQQLIDLVGEDEEHHSFRQVSMDDYLTTLTGDQRTGRDELGSGGVAVVMARGTILDGTHPPGTIGGDSTADLIRRAREDEGTKAIVLRVDSGGGSAFASEVIRRELVLAREAGKPVIASMGAVAASGGYWISTASDQIWASPDTITGSIGIYAFFPTANEPLEEYLGIHVDGLGTNWLVGMLRPDLPMDERADRTIELVIANGYQEFLERVSESRGMTVEEVHEVAQGRVWSGVDAHREGLVDSLGTFRDALDAAASLADLEEDYPVRFMEKELDYTDQLLLEMFSKAGAVLKLDERALPRRTLLSLVEDLVGDELAPLQKGSDPMGLWAHCLCEVR